ncbi:MAG: hypothetical protein AAB929_01945 [Patescibacteria group bacterium]
MEQTFSSWNVVILFNEVLTEELIKLNMFVTAKIPSKIVLNKTDALPHMTIYTTNYPVKNLPKIKKELALVVRKFHPILLQLSSKVIDMNTVFINADSDVILQQLHTQIVNVLNPLRDGLYDKKELELIGNNEKRKRSLLTYGMWAAKELYIPHISIARPFDASLCKQALDQLPKKIDYLTKIECIALVERGHDGTCKKIIETYSLGV